MFESIDWLEIVGVVSGRRLRLALDQRERPHFPIGLTYAVVTVIVVGRANLYADVLLNVYYVVMNAYGWYFWLYGDKHRRDAAGLQVAFVPLRQWPLVIGITVAATGLMGWAFDTYTDADLAYPDSFTTVASFMAMWMTARKYLENWVVWFVVDVIQIGLYMIKGIELYALLYAIYLLMAVAGWLSWKSTCGQRKRSVAVRPDRSGIHRQNDHRRRACARARCAARAGGGAKLPCRQGSLSAVGSPRDRAPAEPRRAHRLRRRLDHRRHGPAGHRHLVAGALRAAAASPRGRVRIANGAPLSGVPADIPWEPDRLREHPEDRDRLFDAYLRDLKARRLQFDVLEGPDRADQALEIVRKR